MKPSDSLPSFSFNTPQDIAVIGMTGLFPGARGVEQLWRNLKHGLDSLTDLSREELLEAGVDPDRVDDPTYVRRAGVIAGIEHFDAEFFGLSPREAEQMDPQHRVFLEAAWHALEFAGYSTDSFSGRIGVFAGSANSQYRPSGSDGAFSSNEKDHLATRVAYKLNLRGPAVSIQTTCSTSLVAVCIAIQNLLLKDCDLALAGGVSLRIPQHTGYLFREGGMHSPDGVCRPFDAEARGTIFSSGLGLVVLRRLSDAIASGDHILAIIKGSAINNDGFAKVGYTAPSISGQAGAIRRALETALISADEVGYVEAHGTGTELGDPIEFAALTDAHGSTAHKKCALGSVKANIGHLNSAAGVAGLIKAILCVKEGVIPSVLHYKSPNSKLGDLAASRFYVSDRTIPWPAEFSKRIAGVSSFGIGGTNSHVIVQEPPAATPSRSHRTYCVLPMSARTEAALVSVQAALAERFATNQELNVCDAAFTLQVGRKAFPYRSSFVCRDHAECLDRLRIPPEPVRTISHDSVAFLFPGQGSQYPLATREIYREEPVFREAMDHCIELFSYNGIDVRGSLYDDPTVSSNPDQFFATSLAQPIIFAVSWSLAQFWISLGVRPSVLLGHSVGEYVAACVSGVFSLEDAIRLVSRRALLMETLPPGRMLSVSAGVEHCRRLISAYGDQLEIAAINGNASTVICGPVAVVESFRSHLEMLGVDSHQLRTSHAFHSAMVEPILEELRQLVRSFSFHAPQIPIISSVSGVRLAAAKCADPNYWAEHVRRTVQFQAGLGTLMLSQPKVILEVGPGRALSTLVLDESPDSGLVVIASMPHHRDGKSELRVLAQAVAALWTSGVSIDWATYNSAQRLSRVPMPGYAFQRRRFWSNSRASEPSNSQKKEQRAPLDRCFFGLTWRRKDFVVNLPICERLPVNAVWVLLSEDPTLSAPLQAQLKSLRQRCVLLNRATEYRCVEIDCYELDFDDGACQKKLVQEVLAGIVGPTYLLDLTPAALGHSGRGAAGFFRIIHLLQAYSSLGLTPRLKIAIAATGVYRVLGEEIMDPQKALLLGPLTVAPQEFPGVSIRLLDLHEKDLREAGVPVARRVLEECVQWPREVIVALRGEHRWIQEMEPIRSLMSVPNKVMRTGGVYLIVGGLGGIGFAIAKWLAKESKVHLILTTRRPVPPRASWESLIAAGDPSAKELESLISLERDGCASLNVRRLELADAPSTAELIDWIRRSIGEINGVFHAAGLPGGGVIELRSDVQMREVLAPKVEGTDNLLAALSKYPVDFILLLSSVEGIRGSNGQVDYAAANAYQDAVACSLKGRSHTPVFSINWAAWGEVGMAVNTAVPAEMRHQREHLLRNGLTVAEGLEAIRRILHSDRCQVVVTPRELHLPSGESAGPAKSKDSPPPSTGGDAPVKEYQRPNLESSYVAPESEIQEQLAVLWRKFLGVGKIGINDNFFALGGHSLMAVRLTFAIRSQFSVAFSLKDLFSAPTIAEMELAIVLQLTSLINPAELEEMVNSIQSLSPPQNDVAVTGKSTDG